MLRDVILHHQFNQQKTIKMKQIKTIDSIENLNVNEMANLKGGFSLNTQNSQSSITEYYIYIDGVRYRVTSKGIEPA